jgi:excisionase family DNA binding protein
VTVAPLAGQPTPLTCTVPQAAAMLGISGWAYYQGLKRGDLPGLRVGRRWVVPLVQLHRFLEDGPRVTADPG